jgi:hypothetical protein
MAAGSTYKSGCTLSRTSFSAIEDSGSFTLVAEVPDRADDLEYFQGQLIEAVTQFGEEFDAGNHARLLQSLDLFPTSPRFYPNGEVFAVFREQDIIPHLFELIDMVNTTASDQDVLIAEAAICDRAMIVLLNLSQSSELYGIEFMNPDYRFIERLHRNRDFFSPFAVAASLYILSNMVVDATEESVDELVQIDPKTSTSQYEKLSELAAPKRESRLVHSAFRHLVFALCYKDTPDPSRRLPFYQKVLDETLEAVPEINAVKDDYRDGLLKKAFDTIEILTRKYCPLAARLFGSPHLQMIVNCFQSSNNQLVEVSLAIFVNLMRQSDSVDVIGQLAASLPWQRFMRLLVESFPWHANLIEIVKKISCYPVLLEGLLTLNIVPKFIKRFDTLTFEVRHRVGEMLTLIIHNATPEQCQLLVRMDIFGPVFDLLADDAFVSEVLIAINAHCRKLAQASIPLDEVVEAFARHNGVSRLEDLDEEFQEVAQCICEQFRLV